MKLSANEIQGLATKAARGAGFPPGQSETFGRATVVHLAAARDAKAISSALQNAGNSPILRLSLLVDDILLACAAMKGEAEITLHPHDAPMALSYARLTPVRLTDCALIDRDDQPRLRVSADLGTPSRPSLPPRIDMPERLHDELSTLAAKTYVPATAASRLRGAGAGLRDND
ncbi:DUF3726 domain-containing protein [Thalassococcus sp. BH17M4-6]|uniref:DUF3726 domain-containing protein n=1 Tax=Thalassococcus sp. BH17M4-6 TaxID=3413148 RepID=UPI003BDBCAD1